MSGDSRRVILDPRAAYNGLEPGYSGYSRSRLPYLQSVERLITTSITGDRSLLDMGSGDGCRARRIAESAKITDIVLVEPSRAMSNLCMADCEVWSCKASEIPRSTHRFDVITCLWHVLGHIEADERRPSLARLKQLLSPSGTLFL